MNDILNNSSCGRGEDLIAILYDEADERQKLDFKTHLQECGDCQSEFASFVDVRKSIGLWKSEALDGAFGRQVSAPEKQRSAVEALRQFFYLSPIWMKAAVSFAVVVFCVMAGALIYLGKPQPSTITVKTEGQYTQQQMNEAVAKALAEQSNKPAALKESKEQNILAESSRNPRLAAPGRSTKLTARKALSKAEREQLAADLRLLSPHDEDTLSLLGDRITKEF